MDASEHTPMGRPPKEMAAHLGAAISYKTLHDEFQKHPESGDVFEVGRFASHFLRCGMRRVGALIVDAGVRLQAYPRVRHEMGEALVRGPETLVRKEQDAVRQSGPDSISPLENYVPGLGRERLEKSKAYEHGWPEGTFSEDNYFSASEPMSLAMLPTSRFSNRRFVTVIYEAVATRRGQTKVGESASLVFSSTLYLGKADGAALPTHWAIMNSRSEPCGHLSVQEIMSVIGPAMSDLSYRSLTRN